MEAENVFVTCGTQTFGILLPDGCKYIDLVEKICGEMKITTSSAVLKIHYDVGDNMSPLVIENDNSLIFYMELKRKDARLTAYALRVDVEHVFNMYGDESCNDVNTTNSQIVPMMERPAPDGLHLIPAPKVPTINEFAASIQVIDLPDEEEDNGNIYSSISNPGEGCVVENQVFRDKNVMKKSLAIYAIKNNFQFIVYKSDGREYVLICRGDGCKWKFRVSRLGKTDQFKVRYIRNGHSCQMDSIIRDHRQAKSSLICEFIKHKYTSARTIYTPVDIIHDMSTTYGLTLGYGKAWRAREHALEEVMGDPDEAYTKLPMYLSELEERNPGTKTCLEIDGDGHFRYAFMSLGASIHGWIHCKPVVVVDATFLTGRYGGSLFTACTLDANNSIFILAFGVGDSENNDSWSWFLQRFKDAYGERDDMCIVSDRHPSIEYAVNSVYPGVNHGFCAHHLLQNLRKTYGKSASSIAGPFNAAARAYTKHEFDYHMKQLDDINPGIRTDLAKVGFDKWSRAHSHRNRYTVMTSNIVESVNAVTKSVKHCPIDYLFESLRQLIQTWFSKKRSIANGTFTRLASKSERIMRDNATISRKLKVCASSELLYQVSDEISKHVVDMELLTCTCNHFQVDGIPCPHGLAVIGEIGELPYKYCSRYHTKECYVACYAGLIVPLGDRSQWKIDNYRCHGKILPPKSKRPSGRPKKARRRSRVELSKPTKCGRCGGLGHNRRTCKQPKPLVCLGKRKRGSEL